MPKMNIKRSIYIDAKPQEVFDKVNDFHHWTAWSPWLIMEKGVNVNIEKDGKSYSWEGDRIGSGNMKVNSEKENESIDMDLNFIKPWKSFAKIGMEVKPNGKGVDVSWTMDSSLPFFMFWMKKQMEAYVGMDYERGLLMLKDLVEDGQVHSELTLEGTGSFDGGKYIGIRGTCGLDDMGKDMADRMGKLGAFIKDNNVETAGEALSVYHKWDLLNRKTEYTTGFFVKEAPSNISAPFFIAEIPKLNANIVSHKGAYEHLGNAWGLQNMMLRGKEFKGNKKMDPFEVYKNSPENTEKSELLTEVYFATK